VSDHDHRGEYADERHDHDLDYDNGVGWWCPEHGDQP
jgi:hypothetical protein